MTESQLQSLQWLSLAPDLQGADLAVASSPAAGQVYLTLRAKITICDLFFADATENMKKAPVGKRNSAAKKAQS
jgi:hypothetical protein